MDQYVTGSTIKALREKKKLTQKQLAELLAVSDKTISKWETQKGLPDITLINPLAETLGVSIGELLSGPGLRKYYLCGWKRFFSLLWNCASAFGSRSD